jgi:hypothetical protein
MLSKKEVLSCVPVAKKLSNVFSPLLAKWGIGALGLWKEDGSGCVELVELSVGASEV